MAIGAAVSQYWGMTITPTGTPMVCPVIISVTNTANAIGPIIDAQIMTMTTPSEPPAEPYLDFVDIIFNAVKTITWTVIESLPPNCANTAVVTIS